MDRQVIARRLPAGEVHIIIRLQWLRLLGDERTVQRLELSALSSPRVWQ